MEMYQVKSTAMNAIGYDAATMKMTIIFKQGDAYDFCRVPSTVFQQLLSSPSKGKFYDRHIKDKYRCF